LFGRRFFVLLLFCSGNILLANRFACCLNGLVQLLRARSGGIWLAA
jgi:hypothetical protein